MKKVLISLLAVAVLSCSTFATVTNENRKDTYVIDDTSTFTYAYTFDIVSPGDVYVTFYDTDGAVIVIVMTRVTSAAPAANEYYVDETNGNVIIGGAGTLRTQYVATITQLLIARTVDATQESSFPTATALRSTAIEGALDKNVLLMQQISEEISRCLKIPIQDDATLVTTLDPAATRAGLFQAYDASGNPVLRDGTTGVVVSAFSESYLDDADEAAFKATTNIEAGTDFHAYTANGNTILTDAGVLSLAGLTTAANKMPYTTASDTYAAASLTAFARTILDDADAATVRTTLGVTASSANAVSKLGTTAYTGTGAGFKDEDDMVSNSAVVTASQQSIKAYVDAQIVAAITLSVYTTKDSETNDMLLAHAYKAATDGYVAVYINIGGAGEYITGYVDDTDDPAGAGTFLIRQETSTVNSDNSISFLVAKDEYFEITTNSGETPTIHWKSFGTLSAPIDQD